MLVRYAGKETYRICSTDIDTGCFGWYPRPCRSNLCLLVGGGDWSTSVWRYECAAAGTGAGDTGENRSGSRSTRVPARCPLPFEQAQCRLAANPSASASCLIYRAGDSPAGRHVQYPHWSPELSRCLRLLFIPSVHERIHHLRGQTSTAGAQSDAHTFLIPGKKGLRYVAATLR